MVLRSRGLPYVTLPSMQSGTRINFSCLGLIRLCLRILPIVCLLCSPSMQILMLKFSLVDLLYISKEIACEFGVRVFF